VLNEDILDMVRISDIGDTKKPRGKHRIVGKRVGRDESASFDLASERMERRFAGLADSELKSYVETAGRDFLSAPSQDRLTQYRDLLREVIERAVSGGLALAGERKFALDSKTFSVVIRINANLLELAEEIRRSELDRIRMGRLVEEMKGLVADLLC
jgi:uncharacterized protein YaaR (DUF327 family)